MRPATDPGPVADADLTELEFHEVDAARWGDLERLFESRGGPSHCWCMVWRPAPAQVRTAGPAVRKAALHERVAAGVPIGILGYLDGEPVAWCSIAPCETYRRLGGVEDDDDERVWSLVCFFIPRRLRGRGISARLIEAAAQHARRHGATVLEAYPVDADSPSYRFMGFVPKFQAAGFGEVGRAGTRRHVMRLRLG
jgi:GNAT superfamily N-acetyltransferase